MMFSNCLILLCIGVHVTCQTTPSHSELRTGILETKRYLKNVMEEKMPTNITDMVDIPTTLTKTCAKNNLETFINSLNSVTEFGSNILMICLKNLEKHWPQNKGKDCRTSKGGFQELLQDLQRLLNELPSYLVSKEATMQNTWFLRALFFKRKLA